MEGDQSRSNISSSLMGATCRARGRKRSRLSPAIRPIPCSFKWSQKLSFLFFRSVNQLSQYLASCSVTQARLSSAEHSARRVMASAVTAKVSLLRMNSFIYLRAWATKSFLLKPTIFLKDDTGLTGLKRTSSSSSSMENLEKGLTIASSISSISSRMPSAGLSSRLMSLTRSFQTMCFFCLAFFSLRSIFRANLNSFFAAAISTWAASYLAFSGVMQFLMTGSRGGILLASSQSGLRALWKRVWQKYWRVGLKVFSTLTSSTSPSPCRWCSIILSTSPRTISRCFSVAFLRELKGQSRTSSTVGSSTRQNISREEERQGIRITILGTTPFLLFRATQRASAYFFWVSMVQIIELNSLRLKGLSWGTTMSTSLSRQWRGTLLFSTKPSTLRFLSSKILVPASRMGLMGTSCGPQKKALTMFSLSTMAPLTSPWTTQLVSRVISFSLGMTGSKSTEASYLDSDFILYLRMALQVATWALSPGANSMFPLYLATGLVSRFRNRLYSSIAIEAGKIWMNSDSYSFSRISMAALRSWMPSIISPPRVLSAGLQLTMKSTGMMLTLMPISPTRSAMLRRSFTSSTDAPDPLVNRNMRLLYFLVPQCSSMWSTAVLRALKMSPPGRAFSNRAWLSSSTFRTKSMVGRLSSLRMSELPSSESLSPKHISPSSWVALLKSFCWRVSLQHSRAILAREEPSENSSSMVWPTSTHSSRASFDINDYMEGQLGLNLPHILTKSPPSLQFMSQRSMLSSHGLPVRLCFIYALIVKEGREAAIALELPSFHLGKGDGRADDPVGERGPLLGEHGGAPDGAGRQHRLRVHPQSSLAAQSVLELRHFLRGGAGGHRGTHAVLVRQGNRRGERVCGGLGAA